MKTLAGALVAVRKNDSAMRDKTIDGLKSAMSSRLSRALELARGLQSYVIAADIIGYDAADFKTWVERMITADVQGHSGTGIIGTAIYSATNWGGHARASWAAAALYLNRQDWLTDVANAHKEMLGLPVPNKRFKYDATNWHADPGNKAGINRKGAKRGSVNISGVIPEDWRRGGEFKWLPAKSGYMHEGLQGLVVSAVILHRADIIPITSADNAIVRVMDMLYGRGEAAQNNPVFTYPVESDDRWIPWMVNHYCGTNYPTVPDVQPGKGIGYSEWMYSE